MMKKCLLTLFLAMIAAPGHAEWIAVDSAARQPEETHYFDPQTLQRNGQSTKVWILSSYDSKQKGEYHAAKSLYEFNCSDNQARLITLLLYPDKKASGAVIGARHEESMAWFGFSSDSIFQHISEIICIN
jgi:hypothetical protein